MHRWSKPVLPPFPQSTRAKSRPSCSWWHLLQALSAFESRPWKPRRFATRCLSSAWQSRQRWSDSCPPATWHLVQLANPSRFACPLLSGPGENTWARAAAATVQTASSAAHDARRIR